MNLPEYAATSTPDGHITLWTRGNSVRVPAYLSLSTRKKSVSLSLSGGGVETSGDVPNFDGFVPVPRDYPRAYGGEERNAVLSVSVSIKGESEAAFSVGAGVPAVGERSEGGYPWPFTWNGYEEYFSEAFVSEDSSHQLARLPVVSPLNMILMWFTPEGNRLSLPAAALSSSVSVKTSDWAKDSAVGTLCVADSATLTYATYPVPEQCADSLTTMLASPSLYGYKTIFDEVKSVNIKTIGGNLYAEVTVSTRLYFIIL